MTDNYLLAFLAIIAQYMDGENILRWYFKKICYFKNMKQMNDTPDCVIVLTQNNRIFINGSNDT